MNPQFPRIAERLDHLGFLRQVGIGTVLHVALVDERLEVAAVLDSIGRVDVDHLHLPGHAFLDQQAVHHQQAVAGDQPVAPALVVAIEVDRVAQRQALERRFEQARLYAATNLVLARPVVPCLAHRGEDAHRVRPLVHVQADRVDLEAGALGLARPLQVRRALAFQLFQCGAHRVGVA